MLGSVAGYAKHHYYLGTPEQRRETKACGSLYKGKKKWIKRINPRKKKYPMIIKEAK